MNAKIFFIFKNVKLDDKVIMCDKISVLMQSMPKRYNSINNKILIYQSSNYVQISDHNYEVDINDAKYLYQI